MFCAVNCNPRCLQVLALLAEMRKRNIAPTIATYHVALAACDAAGDIATALELYYEACEEGIQPTDPVHNQLICICAEWGNVGEALEQIKALLRRRSAMEHRAINSLTRALCESGHVGAHSDELIPINR